VCSGWVWMRVSVKLCPVGRVAAIFSILGGPRAIQGALPCLSARGRAIAPGGSDVMWAKKYSRRKRKDSTQPTSNISSGSI
jgi:hypothetical protein